MQWFKQVLPFSRSSQPIEAQPADVRAILAQRSIRRSRPLPPPTPNGKMRVHFFAGTFVDQSAARHYCFFSQDDRPEDLRRELPDAYIDTDHVDVWYGDYKSPLYNFMPEGDVTKVAAQCETDNTLVMISEPAFGGIGYALNDTSRLRYLGPRVVDI